MFKTYSATYASAIAMLLGYALRVLGVEAKDEELVEGVSALLVLVGFLGVLHERFKKGGITLSGVKVALKKGKKIV